MYIASVWRQEERLKDAADLMLYCLYSRTNVESFMRCFREVAIKPSEELVSTAGEWYRSAISSYADIRYGRNEQGLKSDYLRIMGWVAPEEDEEGIIMHTTKKVRCR